jgi:hypothetical protein
MLQRQHIQPSRRQILPAIRPKPVRAEIQPASGTPSISLRAKPDRRNFLGRERLMLRVRQEFEDMPGLSLTLAQAVRLLGVPTDICLRVLTTLVARGQLRITTRARTFDSRYNVYRAS